MTELLQPRRKWKRVRGGLNTMMRRCPDCRLLMLEGDVWDHEQVHLWLDELADAIQFRRLGADEPVPEGVTIEGAPAGTELARPPLADRVPVAYEHRLIRGAWQQIRALLRPAPAPELPPATIRRPPVPDYVADAARRQLHRTERATASLSKRQED